MAKRYHYIRFNWLRRVDLEEAAEELGEKFSVRLVRIPWDDMLVSLDQSMNEELRVRADTLRAFLTPFRVILFQKEAAPFTARDMELRKRMMELYPRDRPTPFPFMFGIEPKFDKVE